MTIDFLKVADSLQEELQEFYGVLRGGGDEKERQAAIERLRAAVNQVERLASDPPEAGKSLAVEQRWGYMRVLSHVGTATRELKSV